MRVYMRKCMALLTAFALLFCLMGMSVCMWVLAENQTGIVNGLDSGSVLYVRKTASTSATILARLKNGDKVTVLDTTESGGVKWYKVTTADGVTGYSSAQFISIQVQYVPDADFEAYLTSQKFPESYKDALRNLHAKYPNWMFAAQHLNLDWKTALNAEAQVGRNLVLDGSCKESWKSMEYGAYNWDTKKYVVFDSGGWVSAQREVVAYYMDPRNFLDETAIFQFEMLSYSPAHTQAGVAAILKGSFMEKMAKDFLDVAQAKNVSAYMLASRALQEQGKDGNALGTGTVANFKVDGTEQKVYGYYNIFDIGAYAANGLSAIQNGALYAKSKGWDTAKKSIEGGADQLGKGYISKGQNTLYLQKFDVVDGGNGYYNWQYMTNVTAAKAESNIMKKAYSDEVLGGTMVFSIPVYLNMPDKPQAAPQSDKNNDNTLTGLSVEGYSLTPTFSRYTTEYAVTVPKDVQTVTVNAVKSDKEATVSGTGKVGLSGESTVITVKVTAPSGLVRNYTITVNRPGGQGDTKLPSLGKCTYTVDTYVTGIKPGTTAENLLKGITVNNGTARLVTADGKVASGKVATGQRLQLMAGDKVHAEYPLVIYGDTSGDGAVTSKDLLMAQKHILGVSKLNGAALTAADSGKDGKLTSSDLLRTQKQILGVSSVIV